MRKFVPATIRLTAVGFSKPTILNIVAELRVISDDVRPASPKIG